MENKNSLLDPFIKFYNDGLVNCYYQMTEKEVFYHLTR